MQRILLFILPILIFQGCKNNTTEADAYGNFEADEIIVSSEAGGKILQMNIRRGQQVQCGELTAVIDTTSVILQLARSEANIEAIRSRRITVQAQVEVLEEQNRILEREKNRTLKLLDDGAATQKQLDDIEGQINVINKQIAHAKTNYLTIEKELLVVESAMDLLKDRLKKCRILAPVNGTILETYLEQGELAATGKPLYKIANLEELTLKVYVSGSQLPGVKIGQSAEVIIDKSESENQSLKGEVSWISPEAEFTPKIIQTKEERVKLVYAVKVVVKNDGTLKIGMPGEVLF